MGRDVGHTPGAWTLPGGRVEEVSLEGRSFLVVSYDTASGRKLWVFEETPTAMLPLALRREVRSDMPAEKAVLGFLMGRETFPDEVGLLRTRIRTLDRMYLKSQEEAARLRLELGRLAGKRRRGNHGRRNP